MTMRYKTMFLFILGLTLLAPSFVCSAEDKQAASELTKDPFGMVWVDPSFDMKQYDTIVIERPDTSSLPTPAKFDYSEFAKTFQLNLLAQIKQSGTFKYVFSNKDMLGETKRALVVKSEIVELNPGSAAARFWVGFGAGRAAVAAQASMYVLINGPVTQSAVLKWSGRKLGVSSLDSMAMLNKGMIGLSELLNSYILRVYKEGK